MQSIKRNLKSPNYVAMFWRRQDSEEPLRTLIKVGESKVEADKFVGDIIHKMNDQGVLYKKNVQKKVAISEREVKMSSIAQMDIEVIHVHIQNYEKALNEGDLNISTIQTLTTLYQKAIEYYSAFDNVMFTDLLNRMQSLLQREDIQVILNSVQEAQTEQRIDT